MKQSEKRIIVIVSAVMLVLIAAAGVFAIIRLTDGSPAFEPPAFDPLAKAGTPLITDDSSLYNSLELMLTSGKLVAALDAAPVLEDGRLNLYLTSDENNTAYIRVVLYAEDGTEAGSSGMIRPGEYVPYISVAETVTAGSAVKAKLLTYEPDTYYSLGSANISMTAR